MKFLEEGLLIPIEVPLRKKLWDVALYEFRLIMNYYEKHCHMYWRLYSLNKPSSQYAQQTL